MSWLLLAVAGAAGATCRALVDRAAGPRSRGGSPRGTTLVNLTGSLLVGVVAGLASGAVSLLGTLVLGGFLGAYTTFSTAMLESVQLLEEGAPGRALANLVLPLVVATLAASLGLALATSLG